MTTEKMGERSEPGRRPEDGPPEGWVARRGFRGTGVRVGCHPWKFDRARQLRESPTAGEAALWSFMRRSRGERTRKPKFRRQVILYGYIVDFYHPATRTVIELDGASHDLRVAEDAERTQHLEGRGHRVLRFTEGETVANPQAVYRQILAAVL